MSDRYDMQPPPDLFDAVADAIEAEPAESRPIRRGRALALFGAALAIAAVVFFAYGGLRDGGAPRPPWEIAATTLGAALLTAGGLWLAIGRRSMVTPARLLWAIALGVPLALLGWKLAWSGTFAGGFDPWPGRVGWPCLQISMASGLLPILGLITLRRGSEAGHPRLMGAAFGAVAGGFAWVVTDLWCPVGHVPHLMLGHVLPVLIFALVGAALGGRCLAVRWAPT